MRHKEPSSQCSLPPSARVSSLIQHGSTASIYRYTLTSCNPSVDSVDSVRMVLEVHLLASQIYCVLSSARWFSYIWLLEYWPQNEVISWSSGRKVSALPTRMKHLVSLSPMCLMITDCQTCAACCEGGRASSSFPGVRAVLCRASSSPQWIFRSAARHGGTNCPGSARK